MLRVERHDDVTRLALASRVGRLIGYSASVYVVARDRRTVLVDTGCPRAVGALRDGLASLGVRPDGALVTHHHEDHAGNAAWLARQGVPLGMGDDTRAALAHATSLPLYRRLTWGEMAPLPAGAGVPFDASPLVLVPTPGHSRDHHAVWDPERETLFGGDLYLGVKVRVAHRSEDPRALARSLRAVIALRPRRLFDGHRGLIRDPIPQLAAKAGWIEDTVATMERLLDAGWPAARVRDRLLGREALTGYLSGGEYSRTSFVRAVRDARAG